MTERRKAMPYKLSQRTLYFSFSFLTTFSLLCLCPSVASGQQAVFQSQRGNQYEQQDKEQQGAFPSAEKRPSYPSLLQEGLGEEHPQVLEVPRPQISLPIVSQPEPQTQQSLLESQGETLEPGQNSSFAPSSAYLGLVAKSVRVCRAGEYIAGVRVAGLEKGSPAQRAGMQAEKGVGWKQIVGVLLASTPAAPLAIPFLISGGQDPGDIIVAVDGKRVENKEEFDREMERFRTEDVVYFSVLRGNRTLLVPVGLPSGTEKLSKP
jgi:hypothetical protein